MKRIEELSIMDFKESPAWTWAEEYDESMVTPWVKTDSAENHDALFVLAKFHLHDKTTREGFLAVRTSDLFVYLISLSDDDGKSKDFSLLLDQIPLISKEDLARHINKKTNEIFPLTYQTTDLFPKKIEGTVA